MPARSLYVNYKSSHSSLSGSSLISSSASHQCSPECPASSRQ
nr:MAG TPA: hypothetical protein [Caudoviricetes sp.]